MIFTLDERRHNSTGPAKFDLAAFFSSTNMTGNRSQFPLLQQLIRYTLSGRKYVQTSVIPIQGV